MVNSNAARLDAVFHALSDETRRSILRAVAKKEKTISEIAKVLDAAELIARERRGSFQIIRLNAKSLRPAEQWLAFYETFWTERIDALQSYLEQGDHNGGERN